jgi:hypothetical protein
MRYYSYYKSPKARAIFKAAERKMGCINGLHKMNNYVHIPDPTVNEDGHTKVRAKGALLPTRDDFITRQPPNKKPQKESQKITKSKIHRHKK